MRDWEDEGFIRGCVAAGYPRYHAEFSAMDEAVMLINSHPAVAAGTRRGLARLHLREGLLMGARRLAQRRERYNARRRWTAPGGTRLLHAGSGYAIVAQDARLAGACYG